MAAGKTGRVEPMTDSSFESSLRGRVDEMLQACTRCGKCVEACPSVEPAGIGLANPRDVVSGVLDIVRTGRGPDASGTWAAACMLSGDCIKACEEGVNPRFLLAMARVAMAKEKSGLDRRRGEGVQKFRDLSQDVSVLSRLQLDDEALERLGQGSAGVPKSGPEADADADFVFYTGCNVLKTPHIALLALDILDRLGVSYRVMGGPSHCCGVNQLRTGDVEMSGRMGASTVEKLSHTARGQVLAWCPSCYVQFTETTLPTLNQQRGSQPFEMIPFLRFLGSRLDQLQPHLRQRVQMRVALHRHPGVPGVMEAAAAILRAVPGVELIDLKQPAVGLQSVNLSVLPAFKRELQMSELCAAREAGIDALVAVYHSDHRELCAHERDWPFRILNILDVVGESMGLMRHDRFKSLKIMQDADLIIAQCRDLMARHGLDPDRARSVVIKAMLADQPVALMGGPQKEAGDPAPAVGGVGQPATPQS
jgi:heterodisulfide reductase subunit D